MDWGSLQLKVIDAMMPHSNDHLCYGVTPASADSSPNRINSLNHDHSSLAHQTPSRLEGRPARRTDWASHG